MGNIQAQIKSEIHILFKVGSQAEFSTKIQRILNMEISLDDLHDCVVPQQVRDCIEQHFEYFSFLFQYLVDLLRDVSAVTKNVSQECAVQCRNSLMLLSKFISTLHEPKYTEQSYKLLWSTSNSKMTINEKKFQKQRVTLIKVNDQSMDQQEVNQMIKPNILVLLDSLLKLCFHPNFTIVPLQEQSSFNLENDEKLKAFLKFMWNRYAYRADLSLIWRGFGAFVKYPNDSKDYIENRIIILQCMIACFGQTLFRPKNYALNSTHSSPLIIQRVMSGESKQQVLNDQSMDESTPKQHHLENYINLNSALISFVSLRRGHLKELLISLWGTILYHKYSFFWFQDNALLVKKQPRILAGLSAQVLLYILTELPDHQEIAKQIEFNTELHQVYDYLIDFQEEEKQDKQSSEEELKQLTLKQPRRSLLQRGQTEVIDSLSDCKQVFTNPVRDIMCSVDSEEFFESSLDHILENLSAPFLQETKLISTRAFDMSGVTECLGLLLFILQNNEHCGKTIRSFKADKIKQIINILLYQQVKYAEGQLNQIAHDLCTKIMILLSLNDNFGQVIMEPISFSIAFSAVPTMTGSYGDFFVTLYCYLIFKDFQSKMHSLTTKDAPKQKIPQQDSLSKVLFHISPHIRQLSQQASFYLAQAFYAYISYEFLFQHTQNALSFEDLLLTINNVLCFDLQGNCSLASELTKRQIEFSSLLKFKVGPSQLKHFFTKYLRSKLPICLPTEKTELIMENQATLKLESLEVSRKQSLNIAGDQPEEQPQFVDEYESQFLAYYADWVELAPVFTQPTLDRLKRFLQQYLTLVIKSNLNPLSISKEDTQKILETQVWIGIMDRSQVITKSRQPITSNQEGQFRDAVLHNALSGQEWFPQFDKQYCIYI